MGTYLVITPGVETDGVNRYRMSKVGSTEAVFDIMTYYFRHSDIRASSLTNEREVKQAFIDLCDNDDKFTDALQTTTKSIQATFGRLHTWGDS